MSGNIVAIIILFVLVAGAYFAIHKHASNAALHKAPGTPAKPTTPVSPPVGGGGGVPGKPPIEQR